MNCPKCNKEFPTERAVKIHQMFCVLPVPEPSPAPGSEVPVPREIPGEYMAEEIVSPGKAEESPGVAASAFPQESPEHDGFHVFHPVSDPNFMVDNDTKATLEIVEKISAKHPVNVLVTGQPGGGKTSLGLQYAAKHFRPCVVVDFGVLQEPQELFHTTYLKSEDGASFTDIRESGFVKGLETSRCVVILDELNRPENERVLNVLLPLLDGRRECYVDYLRRVVRVADGVVFIATLNEGAMFCGVTSVDTALRDRFREIHMPYLPPETEAKVIATKTGIPDNVAFILADFAAKVRNSVAIQRKTSTRQLLTAAESFAHGDELWRAVSSAIGHYNDISWREQVMECFSLALRDPNELNKWQVAKRRFIGKYEAF